MSEIQPPAPRARPGARKGGQRKPAKGKTETDTLRKLARTHTEASVQALAEVVATGTSEASRISAAMALLDRGYGKIGTGLAGSDSERAAVLYQRIELIDGNTEKPEQDNQAADRTD